MLLTILSTTSKKEFDVVWLEINTPTGNMVIQDQHAPLITLLNKHEEIVYGFSTGKNESLIVPNGGILKITRTTALLIMN